MANYETVKRLLAEWAGPSAAEDMVAAYRVDDRKTKEPHEEYPYAAVCKEVGGFKLWVLGEKDGFSFAPYYDSELHAVTAIPFGPHTALPPPKPDPSSDEG